MFTHSIEELENKIEKAAKKVDRSPEDIQLIAVTKTRSKNEVQAVLDAGLTALGENRVQELESKYHQFNQPVHWHLIGHLQRNKVKYIIDKVTYIHSVDSVRLARKINNEAAKQGRVMKILIQVNVADEDSKFGLQIDQVESVIKEISTFENIKVKGLMAMAPYTVKPEESRQYFRKLKEISVDIDNQKIDNICMKELSMGMTNDYSVAIEEGATMIRVGTGIFGERNDNK